MQSEHVQGQPVFLLCWRGPRHYSLLLLRLLISAVLLIDKYSLSYNYDWFVFCVCVWGGVVAVAQSGVCFSKPANEES